MKVAGKMQLFNENRPKFKTNTTATTIGKRSLLWYKICCLNSNIDEV